MFFAATPAAISWRRLASTRSRKIFFGNSLWPGARAVRNSSGYFSRTGSDSSTSRNSLLPYSNWDSNWSTHLRTNRVAAAMNTGTDGRLDIAGPSAKPTMHLAHTFLHDPFYGPTPARVKDSHRPAFCVHQNDGQAIGGQNCEQQTRGLGDQAVAREPRLADLRNAMNEVRVNLAQGNQRPLAPLAGWLRLCGRNLQAARFCSTARRESSRVKPRFRLRLP